MILGPVPDAFIFFDHLFNSLSIEYCDIHERMAVCTLPSELAEVEFYFQDFNLTVGYFSTTEPGYLVSE